MPVGEGAKRVTTVMGRIPEKGSQDGLSPARTEDKRPGTNETKGILGAVATLLQSAAAREQRALLFAFALTVGAVFYFTLEAEPPIVLIGLLALLAGLQFMWVRANSTSILAPAFALVLLGFIGGIAAGAMRTQFVQAPQIASETRPLMVEGWVTDVESARKGVRLRIKVHALSGTAPEETPRFVRLTHMSRLEMAPGRFVRCWAVLRPPPAPQLPGDFDFRRQAYFQQLGAVGFVQGRCRGGALGAPNSWHAQIDLQISALRRQLGLAVADAAGERAGGFAAALVTGDRSLMPQEDQDALQESGLSHLLAVSGLNMMIAGGLIFLISWRVLALIEPLALRVAVKRPAAFIALTTTSAYFIVSGMSVPAQRAYIMCVIVFGAVMADRSAITLHTFALALIALVLMQPESVMAPGFQMSFAATGALVAVYEAWSKRRRGRERVLGPIGFSIVSLPVTSIVAGAATLPFSLYHFDRQATFGLLANFLAMPIITYATAPAAALALLLAPFGESAWGLRLFGLSLEGVLWVADACAGLAPGGMTPGKPMPAASLGLFCVSLGGLLLLRGSHVVKALVLIAPLVTAGWIWISSTKIDAHVSASGDVFVRQAGEVKRANILKGDGLAPLRFADVTEAGACEKPPCEVQIPAGRLRFDRAAPLNCDAASAYRLWIVLPPETPKRLKKAPTIEPADIAKVEAAPKEPARLPECGNVVAWRAIERHGGLTFLDGHSKPVRPIPCGGRPWMVCQREF
jgi:competence protein ComEC